MPLDPADVRVLHRVRVVSPLAATARVAALLVPHEAVVAIDRVVAAGIVDLAALRAASRRRALPPPGCGGPVPGRTAWPDHRRGRGCAS